MSDLEVYSRQGFGQFVAINAPVALLIVDFVDGFADPGEFGGGNIPEAIRATIPVLQMFRDRSLPIAHTRIIFSEDGSDATVLAQKV
jgi:maleamate amidohydrolase